MIDYNLKNCNGYRYIPGDLPEVIEKASPCAQRLWFYLIRKVECRKDKKILIGKTISNYEKLLTGISWIERGKTKTFTLKQIRNAIAYLKKEGIISVKQLPGGSLGFLITFNEYRYLQTWENYKKEKGQGVETPRQANANGFDAFENEKGQGVNCEKGQAMSTLTTASVSYSSLYNTNNYSFSMSETENAENFNKKDKDKDMMPEYDNEFEEIVRQYEREKRDREGYSYDPDEEDLEDNCDDME